MQNRSLLLLASQVWQRRNRHCRVSGVCLQQGHFEGALYCSQPALQTLVWQDPALNSPWPMSAASLLLVLGCEPRLQFRGYSTNEHRLSQAALELCWSSVCSWSHGKETAPSRLISSQGKCSEIKPFKNIFRALHSRC